MGKSVKMVQGISRSKGQVNVVRMNRMVGEALRRGGWPSPQPQGQTQHSSAALPVCSLPRSLYKGLLFTQLLNPQLPLLGSSPVLQIQGTVDTVSVPFNSHSQKRDSFDSHVVCLFWTGCLSLDQSTTTKSLATKWIPNASLQRRLIEEVLNSVHSSWSCKHRLARFLKTKQVLYVKTHLTPLEFQWLYFGRCVLNLSQNKLTAWFCLYGLSVK